MVVIYLFRVVHAALTDVDSIAVEDFSKLVVSREVIVYKGKESVSDVGTNIFAEWGLYQSMLFRCLFFRLLGAWFVECKGIRFRLALCGMEGRLGRKMFCGMKGMTVGGGYVLCGGWLLSR